MHFKAAQVTPNSNNHTALLVLNQKVPFQTLETLDHLGQ